VDDAYFEKLYENVTALYRLDQQQGMGQGKAEFGALPGTAVTLLAALGAAWLGIGAYLVADTIKRQKKTR